MITILGWNDTFEDSHSRKRDQLYWFQVPVGTESNGLVAIRRHGRKGLAAFGVFNLLCQMHGGTLGKNLRKAGTLCRSNGQPLSIEMIAYKLRIEETDLRAAIELLSSPEIGWISVDCQRSASEMPTDASEMPRPANALPRDDQHRQTDSTNQNKQTHTPSSSECESGDAFDIVKIWPKQSGTNEAMLAVKAALDAGESAKDIADKTRACAAEIKKSGMATTNRYFLGAATFFQNKRYEDDPATFRRDPGKESNRVEADDVTVQKYVEALGKKNA